MHVEPGLSEGRLRVHQRYQLLKRLVTSLHPIERYDPQRLRIAAVQQVLDHCRGICFGGISFDVSESRPPKSAKDEMDIRIK